MREVKPTQKPVPSSDIKDLFFNSGLLDIWATSLEHKYIDRFGNCHLTAAGMEWIFNELVTKFKIESEQALLAAGYAPAGTFQEGAEVVSRNGTVLWKLPDGDGDHYRWDGDLPKQVPAGSTPQSTGGIGKGAWVSVGDASFRSDVRKGDGSLIGVTPLGTLKDIVNWVTLEQFGADPTGVNNSLAQIQDAFEFANEHGFSVIQNSGVFSISGDGDITINTNTDFNGAIFRPENWNGSFSIKRKNNWETHDASSLIVKKIKESGVIGKGGNFIHSLVNEDLLNDSFIMINSSQPMYYYRNNIRYRKELNQVLYGGQLLCPMYYSLDTGTITSVLSLKLEKTFIDVSGLSIDESKQNTGVAFVKIANSSKINLNKISFHSRGEYKSNPSERISVSRCAYVFIDGVLCSDVSIASPAGSTYTIYMGESLDININKMTSEGYGWGAVGANEVRRSSFNNSSLSRIDFHNPSMEYLKISNTNIGNWGLLLSCMGDVYLDNVKFIQRDAYNNSGFIRGRDDAGGFCDGNLYAKNVTVEGFYYPNAANRGLISSSSTNNVKELPAGSPLSLSMFNEVNITNLTVADSYKDKDFRLWSAFSNPSLTPPKVFNLTDASTDGRLSFLAMEVSTESKIAVNLKQCIFSELYIRATASVQVESVIDSARSNVNDGVSLALQARGNYNVTNSSIVKLEGFMSDWNLNRNVSISECDVYATKSSDIMRLTNVGSVDWHRNRIHFTASTIADFGNNLNKYIGYSKFYDNSVFVDGVEVIGIPAPATFNLVRNKITRFKLHMVRSGSSTTEDIIFNNESSSFGQYVNVSMSPAQPLLTIDVSVTKRYLV
ncbi:hypothetical protein [Providencia sp. SP181]|uniref:tail fiber/spike domain-containing protein n=1 Tax=Providencia sp. SP181 TaxID=3136277 RepID=UPI003D2DE0A9